jgi:hypothetical protein
MIRWIHLDGAKDESCSCCTLINELNIALGINKSDKDLVGTVHACNQQRGNLGLHVQAFGCLEGPVVE